MRMDSLDEVIARELGQVQQLLDASEKWARSVQTRILELRDTDKEEQVHEREVSLNNDDLHLLLDVDESFSKMYIDLDIEKPEEDEIEYQLLESAEASAKEKREGQLTMIAIQGNRMIMKLASGFQSFKNSTLTKVKEKYKTVMDELDYFAVTDKLKKKATGVQRLRDDLASKRRMLDELIAEEKMTAEELREKYESEVIASRVETLTSRVEDQKHEIQRTSQRHEEVKASVDITKTALAQTLYDLRQKEDKARRFGSKKKKVSRLANDGSMVFDDEMDDEDEKESKRVLQDRYASSLMKVEALLKESSAQAKNVIEKEQKIIKLRSEYDAVVDSEEYQTIQRFISSIALREDQLQECKGKVSKIRAELKNDFGVDETTLDPATKDEILKSRHQRIFRRKERWDKVIESMYDPSKANSIKGENQEIHRPVLVLRGNDLTAVRKIASTLRAAATPGLPSAQNELINQRDRAIQSHFDKAREKSPSNDYTRRERYLKSKNGGLGSPAALSLLGLDKEGSEDVTASMLQDFGFQAIAEQLGVLDNLLKDGSRRHIDASKRATSSREDAASARDAMQELVLDIKKMYKIVNKARRKTKWMDRAIQELRVTRDETRSRFLRMIDGRDNMPKTIHARAGEAEFLNQRIPDLMAEINVVRVAIEQEEALLQKHLKERQKFKLTMSDSDLSDNDGAAPSTKRVYDFSGGSTRGRTIEGERKSKDGTSEEEPKDQIDRQMPFTPLDAPYPDLMDRDPLENETPTVDLVDTATGEPLASITAMHIDVAHKRDRKATHFQSIAGKQSVSAREDSAVREAYGEMADQLRHASLAGSGVSFAKRDGKHRQGNAIPIQVGTSSSMASPRGPSKASSPSPPPPAGFMSKVPSMRSSASAISELSADPSDPFNQALDDYSEWRLNTDYASEDSSYNIGRLRPPGPHDKVRGDALLPVHVINLVVEDPEDAAASPSKSLRKIAPKKPFRLQVTPNIANLHFGGHHTHEHDLQEASALRALAEELPGFYTELQEGVMQGHNPRHWSIPAMPSMLPEDSPLVAKASQNRKERLAMIRRTEKLLERLDVEKKTKRIERRKGKEAVRLREAARRQEEEDVGIFEDLDIDDDDDTAVVVVHDNQPEPADDDSDSDDEEDDRNRSDRKMNVHDILCLLPDDKAKSWVDSKSQVERRNDWIVGVVERYRVALDPASRMSLGMH